MAKKGQTKLTPKEVIQKANEYLRECNEYKKIPLIAEFEYKLGISESTLLKYRENPTCAKAIKRVDKAQEVALVRKGIDENKPVFPIFLLKSKHSYVEQQKLDVTSNGAQVGVVMLPERKSS